eukprot:15248905-Heterocapsa_arctica.AAC.1
MRAAMTNAQWHNPNNHGHNTTNHHLSRHVTILVSTTDLGARIVHATMEDFPQDIINQFIQLYVGPPGAWKQVLTMDGVEMTGPMMAWRRIPNN